MGGGEGKQVTVCVGDQSCSCRAPAGLLRRQHICPHVEAVASLQPLTPALLEATAQVLLKQSAWKSLGQSGLYAFSTVADKQRSYQVNSLSFFCDCPAFQASQGTTACGHLLAAVQLGTPVEQAMARQALEHATSARALSSELPADGSILLRRRFLQNKVSCRLHNKLLICAVLSQVSSRGLASLLSRGLLFWVGSQPPVFFAGSPDLANQEPKQRCQIQWKCACCAEGNCYGCTSSFLLFAQGVAGFAEPTTNARLEASERDLALALAARRALQPELDCSAEAAAAVGSARSMIRQLQRMVKERPEDLVRLVAEVSPAFESAKVPGADFARSREGRQPQPTDSRQPGHTRTRPLFPGRKRAARSTEGDDEAAEEEEAGNSDSGAEGSQPSAGFPVVRGSGGRKVGVSSAVYCTVLCLTLQNHQPYQASRRLSLC